MPQSDRLLAAGGDGRFRPPVLLLLFPFVLAPSLFFAARGSIGAAPISPDDTSSPNFSSHRDYLHFINLHTLDKSWHVLGLGYNPSIDHSEIQNAAVVHYNGNMKLWLELAVTNYRPYWTKYIKYDHPYVRECKLSE
ncbi:hypothetical protein MUK42_20459 [Musa troglodytarum]|uniref:Hexosyltransferase n=1 Tax=Musa troglodytarum TaxID=320322 RepID=A0A9E7EI15_9LILI|nr:hypothetical protein MUK42_20459 [Musa troglodytarum]